MSVPPVFETTTSLPEPESTEALKFAAKPASEFSLSATPATEVMLPAAAHGDRGGRCGRGGGERPVAGDRRRRRDRVVRTGHRGEGAGDRRDVGEVDGDVLSAVRADLEAHRAAGQQRGAVELRRRRDTRELVGEACGLGRDRRTRVGVVGAVRSLDGQVTETLQDRVGLGQCAFRGLDDRRAVLCVASGDREATDLRLEALRDDETSCIIRSTVDAQTAGELLQGLAEARLVRGKVPVGVERTDVGVDLQSHCGSSMNVGCVIGPSVVRHGELSAPCVYALVIAPKWGHRPQRGGTSARNSL